jgi:transcriptional regulator with XRE-family HTH domain
MGRTKVHERQVARALRKEGLSLREIARRLGVSLSSASVWTRDIRPPRGGSAEPSAPADATRSTTLARCGRCCQMLPLANFHFSRGRRQSWCKACRAEYMRQRGELHRRQTRAAREHRRAETRTFVLDLLRSGSCADCAVADPVVLEFDHLGAKTADVAKLVHEGYRLARVKAEVAACEIVCVNCHRRRTATHARTWRTDPDRVASIGRPLRRRNLGFVLEHLRTASCVDCGETDLVLLDFDHLGAKRGSVMVLALDEHSIASLEREISGCEIRCANCHRRRTVQQQPGHLRHHLL